MSVRDDLENARELAKTGELHPVGPAVVGRFRAIRIYIASALAQLEEMERDHEAIRGAGVIPDELEAHAGELDLTANDMEVKAEQMIACLRTLARCLEGDAAHIRAILGAPGEDDDVG